MRAVVSSSSASYAAVMLTGTAMPKLTGEIGFAGGYSGYLGSGIAYTASYIKEMPIEEGIRKVDVWTARHRLIEVPFATDPIDPFFNTNRPEDLAEAERLLERMDRHRQL